MPAATRPKGKATREAILRKAADLASTEGLAGLTIGRLADALAMSKSGLFAHFGSKEELQLATLETARNMFEARVVEPASGALPGLGRLRALLEGWSDYIQGGVFRGGCFFAAASAEFDDRPGKVRDRLVEVTDGWFRLLVDEAARAVARGELPADEDPEQIAFELHAFLHEANRAFQLHGSMEAFTRATLAMARVLQEGAPATNTNL